MDRESNSKTNGLLSDLKEFISTSKQHKNQRAVINIIKQEAKDF